MQCLSLLPPGVGRRLLRAGEYEQVLDDVDAHHVRCCAYIGESRLLVPLQIFRAARGHLGRDPLRRQIRDRDWEETEVSTCGQVKEIDRVNRRHQKFAGCQCLHQVSSVVQAR